MTRVYRCDFCKEMKSIIYSLIIKEKGIWGLFCEARDTADICVDCQMRLHGITWLPESKETFLKIEHEYLE